MKLFIDGEWNSYRGALISMALVSEAGHEWYEVLGCSQPEPWIQKHVMPILNKGAVTIEDAQASLECFLEQFETVHIVADWPEDIAHFCQLLITGPGTRLSTPPLTFEVVRVDAVSKLPHNALADAQALKEKMA